MEQTECFISMILTHYKMLNLPVDVYGYETCSLTSGSNINLEFENRVLRRIFRPNMVVVVGG
jgi:hypothetical protein